MSKIRIGGILENDHLSRISVLGMPDRPDTAALLLNAFGQASLNVQFIVQSLDEHQNAHIILCVDRDDIGRALDLVCRVRAELCVGAVDHDPQVASLGIYGPDFRLRPGIAGTLFAVLAAAGIRVQAISTSISTATVVISAGRLPDAVTAIRQAFDLPPSSG